jgi:hypothetical protein
MKNRRRNLFISPSASLAGFGTSLTLRFVYQLPEGRKLLTRGASLGNRFPHPAFGIRLQLAREREVP